MWKPGDLILHRGRPGIVTETRTSFSAYYHLETGQCGECLNELLERDTNMARPRKSEADKKTAATKKEKSALIEAIKFVAPGFKAEGEAYAQHAVLNDGWLTTYDGIVQYGHPIQEKLTCAPHFGQFRAAMQATHDVAASVTLLDAGKLKIAANTGKFKATVPCISDMALVVRHHPDTVVGTIDSRVREGFEVMKQIASKSGELVLTSSVLMRNGSMIATDGQIIAEYMHGNGFPTLTVPANFVEAVMKVAKSIVSFGFSENSLTFYFDDASYIRTQLYVETWPEVDNVLPQVFNTMAGLPDGFWDALGTLRPFAVKSRQVHLLQDSLQTDANPDIGCAITVPGLYPLPNGGMNIDHMWALREKVTYWDYWSDPRKTTFYGCEGALRGTVVNFTVKGADIGGAPLPTPPQASAEQAPQVEAAPQAPEPPAPPPLAAPAYAIGQFVDVSGWIGRVDAITDHEGAPLYLVTFSNGAQVHYVTEQLAPYAPAAEWVQPQATGEVAYHDGDDPADDDEDEPDAPASSGFGPPV